MTEVKVELNSNVDSEGLKALQTKEEFIMFYQLGFLDAWIFANDIKIKGFSAKGFNREQRLFQRISDKCKKCFEARFFKGIQKQISKVRETQ